MKNKISCCDLCFDEIARKSSAAACLWLDLCSFGQNLLVLNGNDTPQIRWLEILGYLRSTETANQILIQLEGYSETEDGDPYFCCWEEKHG